MPDDPFIELVNALVRMETDTADALEMLANAVENGVLKPYETADVLEDMVRVLRDSAARVSERTNTNSAQ